MSGDRPADPSGNPAGDETDGAGEDLSEDTDLRESTPNSSGPRRAAGDMGVSSERVGHAGPGQDATDGLRDTAPHEREPGEDVPPEQSTGNPEPQPEGLAPKAGYPDRDPRSSTGD
jgi:hypothetical protein